LFVAISYSEASLQLDACMQAAKPLFSGNKYWAECFGIAQFLPMSVAEMTALGWDSCDIIIVCGDAYVDHPSFGMAVVGRTWENQGFRVGIIAQPDWHSAVDFRRLGKPNLFYAVSAGNMDSMINRYTADKKIRHDDAYTPNNEGGKRPDRAATVYSQRCKEAYPEVPVLIGGIEASLRRIAHYDYWSEKVKRSVLLDSKADLLVYGNAERAIVEIAERAARGEALKAMSNIRGTAVMLEQPPQAWASRDSTHIDRPGKVEAPKNPYVYEQDTAANDAADGIAPETELGLNASSGCGKRSDAMAALDVSGDAGKQVEAQILRLLPSPTSKPEYIELPPYDVVKNDPVLYAHASRVLHLETNPANARPLLQRHGDRWLWMNPPAIPLTTEELDDVFELPFQRVPHPSYGEAKIPAFDMIRFSVNIMRGCFGGCSFCSITEHEGRWIQSRSETSVLREIEKIRDMTPGFTGTISDLGGPTANMYHLNCKSEEIHAGCRRLSCVFPTICKNLKTDHSATTQLYRKARALPGVKRVMIASGLRYDLAVRDPEYVEELVTHHVGGYLKIAPEHSEAGPLSKMMKPGMETYHRFKEMFEHFSRKAGKQQYLIPYFIAAHPGTRDEDMLNLALWLKGNGFRADQVQAFYPSPMASATTMYHTGKDPLHRIGRDSDDVVVPKGLKQRRLHKAFLRYHDPDNWPLLRETLQSMGRAHLIGFGKRHLIPPTQPAGWSPKHKRSGPTSARKPAKGAILTQHTGLPPRKGGPAVGGQKKRVAATGRRKQGPVTSR
tara:strand:+ start:65499 stop:67847 length:2349 start_codon:yes stop_codon:yes gene_type:complete